PAALHQPARGAQRRARPHRRRGAGVPADALPDGRWQKLTSKEIAAQRSRIGMVFQRFHLFPHLTALGNVMEAPVQVRGLPKAAAEATSRELLERVGLADRADHYPSELSGG